MQATDLRDLRQLALQRLESLQRAGVMQLPKRNHAATSGQLAEREVSISRPAAESSKQAVPGREPSVAEEAAPSLTAAMPAAVRAVQKEPGWQALDSGSLFHAGAPQNFNVSTAPTLEVLQQEVADCTRCEELARTRTQTVFGVGDPDARLCFVGEAPGADEDRLGEPFVGRAGQLLTKIIEACRMKREEVYILNMLKCRPPGNRTPLPEEVCNCRGYLERQLGLVRPEFICCLGAVAAQNLLGTTVSIGKLRGKVHTLRGTKVVCTYHPAYLLRNPAAKKDTWEDMKLLMREMGMEI